LAQSILKFSR